MSILKAEVCEIVGQNSVHIAHFKVGSHTLSMISLELPNIAVGTKVELNIKPSSVAIAKNFSGKFSFSNRLECEIAKLDIGEILCAALLRFDGGEIAALLSAQAALEMNLQETDKVSAFVNPSEVSIERLI